MKVIFLAGPFRGPTGWDIEQNIRRIEATALEVWRLGVAALAPHMTNRFFHGTLPDQVFLDGVLEMLRRCDAVLMCDGWESSDGAREELREAQTRGLRVFYSVTELRGAVLLKGDW